jgi:hypothetical protein
MDELQGTKSLKPHITRMNRIFRIENNAPSTTKDIVLTPKVVIIRSLILIILNIPVR